MRSDNPSADLASELQQARLAQVLLEQVPGAVLLVGREGGPSLTVARPGDPRADLLPCQHRAALVRAQDSGLARAYAAALDLTLGGALSVTLELPSSADLGLGLAALDDGAHRRICAVTTLCPAHAAAAVRAARTVPLPASHALAREASVADLRLDVSRDRDLGVTLLSWLHNPHPALQGPVEDVARAAVAALAVEELLLSLR
jgi:hypothetical protein